MLRNVLAVVAGIVAGGVVVFGVETMAHSVYPPPEGFDPTTPAGMAAIMGKAPVGALLLVLLAYAAGACVGGFVAAKLASSGSQSKAMIVGIVLLLAGISNLLAIPHPVWMAIGTLIVFLPAAWLGGRLAQM